MRGQVALDRLSTLPKAYHLRDAVNTGVNTRAHNELFFGRPHTAPAYRDRVSSVLVNDAELHDDKSQDEVVIYMDPPQDYPEALSRPEAKHWKKCTKLEMDTLCKNKTWTEVTKNLIPKGKLTF